jgi:invasion protein IalB
MWRLTFFLMAIFFVALCSARAANDVVEPSEVVSFHWSKFCLKGTQPGTQVCFTGPSLPTLCDRPVASASLDEDGTRKRLSVHLRKNVAMERGVRVTVDQGRPIFSGPFHHCNANGCLAVFEGGQELIAQLKSGQNLFVEATDLNGQPIKIALSLDGFADAYFPRAAPLDSAAHEMAEWQRWHALLSREQGGRGNAGQVADCPSGR